jgi:hypothetical protein
LQPLTSFVREPIPLQTALRLVGKGHLDEPLRQGRSEIAFAKGLAVLQMKEVLQRLTGHFAFDDHQQLADLRGDLGGGGGDGVENGDHLRFGQLIPFDGERPAYGADAVDAPQPERLRRIAEDGQPPDGFADFADEGGDGRGDGERRLVLLATLLCNTDCVTCIINIIACKLS